MRYFGLILLLSLGSLFAETADTQKIPTAGLVPLRPAIEVQFAFLCLDEAKMTSADEIQTALVKWFDLKSKDEIRKFKFNEVTKSFSWGIGRSRFVATYEGLPIPKDDIRYAANNSLHWPDAEKQMLTHKAHYTVTCTSIHREPWHAALDLTYALAALADAHKTTGIYWGDASIVHSPEGFQRLASYKLDSAAKIPSSLWIGLLFESDTKGGWNIFTDGFSPLGRQDIEIHSSQLARTKLFTFLNDLQQDVFSNKVDLKDDLILTDADSNKWKVSTGKSAIGKQKPVWIITQQ